MDITSRMCHVIDHIMYNVVCAVYLLDLLGYSFKGRGGGGFSPDFFENTILRYELAMMARTCTNNLRVVLSP